MLGRALLARDSLAAFRAEQKLLFREIARSTQIHHQRAGQVQISQYGRGDQTGSDDLAVAESDCQQMIEVYPEDVHLIVAAVPEPESRRWRS